MFFERFDPAVCVYEKLFSVYFSAVNLTRRQHHHDKWIGIDWGYQHHCAVFWASKVTSVSYTHLDVYKRQPRQRSL